MYLFTIKATVQSLCLFYSGKVCLVECAYFNNHILSLTQVRLRDAYLL